MGRASGRADSAPAGYRNPCSFAGLRFDGELIAQTARSAQAKPEAAACGVAIFQREVEVFDARAAVDESEPYTPARSFVQHLDEHFAAAAVIQRVAGKLARRGDDLRLIHEREAL